MTTQIIDGRKISSEVNLETAEAVKVLVNQHGVTPGLAVIRVGEDPASTVYVKMKVKKCNELGIHSVMDILPADISQADLLKRIDELNADDKIHGILVQLPLPAGMDEDEVINHILPTKDVDCFHPQNVGKMLIGDVDGFFPCTPYGVKILLERSGIDACGKHVVVIGRSNIVGKPMAALMVQKQDGANATVTICHSRTPNIIEFTKQADIVVAAIGKANFLTADMIKPGAVVIDVGINRIKDESTKSGYRLVGDVDFENVAPKSSAITPVPGGVGPMTIAMLMQNTVKAATLIHNIEG
ncbi:MAG: bifunctional methylenetetrahydrofolate dehydrogenase/methenyltetrahydrofolate cyclohydrolase FolD [Lentisphaeria bacterium]|nr:bifunctional methylenetetrahydrofolate dehydrogenase/methenyltetrahydrofolate cyclohydrolase FolD [Lentisphaeria bacterium]